MSSRPELKLDWCSYQAAKYAVEHWHYSKRMPKFKQVYIGAWEEGQFIGCVIFGLSVTPYLGNFFNLSNIECAELTRIGLKHHCNPVSRIVSIAISMIKKQSPGLRLLVSYADPFHGHNGGIYQGSNWIYCGESAPVTQYYWRGSWRNDSSMFRTFKTNPQLRKITKSRRLPAKHKYLFPLDPEMRARILPLAKSYPKRPPIGGAEAPTSGGGSTPTRTLQRIANG